MDELGVFLSLRHMNKEEVLILWAGRRERPEAHPSSFIQELWHFLSFLPPFRVFTNG
jgi:hypothetical protein